MPPRVIELPIHIKPGNLQSSPAIEAWVRRKLSGATRRYGARMTAVEVHFEDVNGPRRGAHDARCVMEARVNGRDPLAVRARARDLYGAIDAAARKLEAALGRAVSRIDTRARRRFRRGREQASDAPAPASAISRGSSGTAATSRAGKRRRTPAGSEVRGVIIAGYGPVGRALADRLTKLRIPFTVVDTNPATARAQENLGVQVLCGDATDREVLRAAGIERAAAIAITIPDGDQAVRACAVARDLSMHVHIAARTTFLSQGLGALRAGANSITVEEVATAEAMAHEVTRRLTARPPRPIGKRAPARRKSV